MITFWIPIQIKQEPVWQQNPVSSASASTDISEYLSRIPTQELPLHLHHFLKFNAETIKRESQVENSPLNGAIISYDYSGQQQQQQQQQVDGNQVQQQQEAHSQDASVGTDIQGDIPAAGEGTEKTKKKRRYKKKPPKPKRPKPGQVHIATALDGTISFLLPGMSSFICDICGAGLKRKEHLERHKLGHNPDRPYICSVCMKGFKRKEHLNLHFVIHSGEKTEICGECGKGFYRKDHLRKHAKSHAMKRMKEELSAQASAAAAAAAASAASSGSITSSIESIVPAVSITAIPTSVLDQIHNHPMRVGTRKSRRGGNVHDSNIRFKSRNFGHQYHNHSCKYQQATTQLYLLKFNSPNLWPPQRRRVQCQMSAYHQLRRLFSRKDKIWV
uniref:Putative c2h2-type zn-finger protein n=1 Tax=Lutzomyia longipalpis TaxID=7200 RepID=A0A1B0CNX7_LUTLO